MKLSSLVDGAVRLLSLVLLGLMIFPVGVFAQDQETILELPANWRSGERYQLELVKEREDYQDESLESSKRSRTLIDVVVLRKFEDGYVIRWSFGKTEMPSGAGRNDPLVAEMVNLAEGLQLDMRTDEFGSVIGLENKDEVIAHYRLVFDVLSQSLRKKGLPSETLALLEAGIAPLMNPATIELLALKEPSIFYAASGGFYQLGVPESYDASLPNPWGGRPFPSKIRFLLRELIPNEDRAVIEITMSLDPDDVTAIIRESMTAMLERMGGQPLSEEDLPTLHIDDFASYVFDTKTGWPLSVNYERNTVSGPKRRVDRLIFRVTSD